MRVYILIRFTFHDEGITQILKYGIACYKKRCKVMILKNP